MSVAAVLLPVRRYDQEDRRTTALSTVMPHSPSSQVIASGHFLKLVNDDGWEYAERTKASGVVAVLAVTEQQQLVLTEQHRRPVRSRVIDLPAGLAGDVPGEETEDLSVAAKRELEEETGFTASSFQPLARFPTSPGLTSETVQLYRAQGVSRIGDGGGDESENIQVHLAPLRDIGRWLESAAADGRLIDPKVYAALWWIEN